MAATEDARRAQRDAQAGAGREGGSLVPPAPAPLEPPSSREGEGARLERQVVSFGRALRQAGLRASPADTCLALQALGAVDVGSEAEVRAALRAAFVHGRDDLPPFEAAFDAFWLGRREPGGPGAEAAGPAGRDASAPPEPGAPGAVEMAEGGGPEPDAPSGADAGGQSYSSVAALIRRDFGRCDPEEEEQLARLSALLARALALRLSRRLRAGARRGPVDLRRSVRTSLRSGGELLRWHRRRRRVAWSRLLMLCDVSGSMAAYSRFLLEFARALGRALPRVEAFVFSTRLTRVTEPLRRQGVQAALQSVAGSGGDWAGGTRIGQSLRQLHEAHGERVDRHTLVMLLSDGLDTGDIALLAQEMAWLRRRARRVLWLNPLASDPRYRPLALGMQAALPFVDVLAPAGNLEHLMDMERHLRPRRLARRTVRA